MTLKELGYQRDKVGERDEWVPTGEGYSTAKYGDNKYFNGQARDKLATDHNGSGG